MIYDDDFIDGDYCHCFNDKNHACIYICNIIIIIIQVRISILIWVCYASPWMFPCLSISGHEILDFFSPFQYLVVRFISIMLGHKLTDRLPNLSWRWSSLFWFSSFVACHDSCTMCFGGLEYHCTACREGHLLQWGRCVPNCGPGFFQLDTTCQGISFKKSLVLIWLNIPEITCPRMVEYLKHF